MSILAHIYRHNLWANLKLLDLCAGLDDALMEASVAGTFGTVRATWGHLLANEERYVLDITGTGPTPDLFELKRQGWPGWTLMRERAQRSGEALVALAETQPEDRVVHGTGEDGQAYELHTQVVMLCAIAHAGEHRAHILTTLSAQGVTAPDLSGWAFDEEEQRAGA